MQEYQQDILNAEEIERKENIPKKDQTDDRDEAADAIERMWPATLTEIAEETGYSRQHIRNTLDVYYRPANTSGPGMNLDELGDLSIPGRERELLQAYRMGYRDGFQDAQNIE